MPDFRFSFEKVEVEPYAVTPLLMFKLRLTNTTPDELIHTIALPRRSRRVYATCSASPSAGLRP